MSIIKFEKASAATLSDESVAAFSLSADSGNPPGDRYDYIIVLHRDIKKSKHFQFVKKYVQYLQERGIRVELAFGNLHEFIYLKLQLIKEFIGDLAKIYGIDIDNVGHNYISVSSLNFSIAQTPVSFNNDIFKRKNEVTNLERILIVYGLLKDGKFGDSPYDNNYGIKKLIQIGAVKAAFPLHDGSCEYDSDSDSLNDRQILLKYWANFSMWYKEQPINLIEKYYGTEVAFYFAWLGLYNFMLIPASALGILCFFISVIAVFGLNNDIIHEVCNSKIMMCPPCTVGHSCIFYKQRNECSYTKVLALFDNYATVFFAIFMSFWATAFLNSWKRTEKILKIRWNVGNILRKTETRLAYKETSTYSRVSLVSGLTEHYTPMRIKAARYCLSYGICLLMLGVVVAAVFAIITYRVTIAATLRNSGVKALALHSVLIESVTTALLQVIFIKTYAKLYAPVSEWLTGLENPRTQLEFDNGVIYKRYFLAFTNNYSSFFYMAFLKGQLFSPSHTTVASLSADLCLSVGCAMSLCIQLITVMLCRSLLGNILRIVVPLITRRFKKLARSSHTPSPQYEQEYLLDPAGRYLLVSEFMDMITQYGFVTFFVAVFPLAPLCALLNNCLQLRLDAYELVASYRRPVPKRNPDIGAWNKIIESMTHFSIVTNAFVLAFTSYIVPREIYKYQHNSLKGYVESTLSVYDMKDSVKFKDVAIVNTLDNSTRCHYAGARYPPEHPRKYQLTNEFWFQLGMRLLCVIVFEHVLVLGNALLSNIIPEASRKLKAGINLEKQKEYEMKMAAMDGKASRQSEGKSSIVVLRRTTS